MSSLRSFSASPRRPQPPPERRRRRELVLLAPPILTTDPLETHRRGMHRNHRVADGSGLTRDAEAAPQSPSSIGSAASGRSPANRYVHAESTGPPMTTSRRRRYSERRSSVGS